jgi:hypothetical protein
MRKLFVVFTGLLLQFGLCVNTFATEMAEESYLTKTKLGDWFADMSNDQFKEVEHVKQQGEVWHWQYPHHYTPHVLYGYLPKANATIRSIARTNSVLVYDSIHSIDKFNRRVNLLKPQFKEKFLILAGCSFTYGTGLNDNQTLNHFINETSEKYYAYNYGVGGSSINLLLARLVLEKDLKSQLEFETGDLVYVFIHDHIARSVGSWPNLWIRSTPYFKKNATGKLEFNGSIEKNDSWFRKVLIDSVEFFPDFLKRNRVIPSLSSSDYDYFCSLVKVVNKLWQTQYQNGRFVFAFHPSQERDEKIIKCLEDNKIRFFHARPNDYAAGYEIPVDHHPNERMNRFFSQRILEFLNGT